MDPWPTHQNIADPIHGLTNVEKRMHYGQVAIYAHHCKRQRRRKSQNVDEVLGDTTVRQ